MTFSPAFLDAPAALRHLQRPETSQTVTFIAPGAVKSQAVSWAILEGPIGRALVAVCMDAVCWLSLDDKGEKELKERFFATWGKAKLTQEVLPLMKQAIKANPPPLPLLVIGTPFQQQVWQKLLCIPRGKLVRYGDIAAAVGKPRAARAVGNAVGSNPVTWLIPCHRVGHSNGSLKGFGWGEACKRRLLALEGALRA